MSAEPLAPAVLGRFLDVASAMVEEQPADDFRDEALASCATVLGNALAAELGDAGTDTEGPSPPDVLAHWFDRTAEMVRDQPAEGFTTPEITDAAVSLCRILLDKLQGAVPRAGLHLVDASRAG
jgi:hypothetical protein